MLYSKIEGEGKPLLILHGFLGMSDNWKTLGNQYALQGFQVHMLDMRNHGRSFHSEDFSYELMVEDVLEYCDANFLEEVSIIGHSMGGKVAMLFAVTFPDRVDKLIIADIGPKYYKPHHQVILAGLSAVDFSQKPDRNKVDEILENYITDFGTRQFLMKNLYWKEPGQLDFRFNLEVLSQKSEEVGKALPEDSSYLQPVLFVKGENSDYILEDDKEEIKKYFPEATFETISNAGHWLHAEKPIEFYQITSDFLK